MMLISISNRLTGDFQDYGVFNIDKINEFIIQYPTLKFIILLNLEN